MLTQTEKDFVQANLRGDVSALALKLGRTTGMNVRLVLQQIAGYQAIEHKIPSWYTHPDLLFPHSLSLEQCSSEATAAYKNLLISRLPDIRRMADLTGGFGVDCSFLAKDRDEVLYVERQAELCDLARHNFDVLGLPQIHVKQGDGVDYLTSHPCEVKNGEDMHGGNEVETTNRRENNLFDLIFLDPARRDRQGGKVVALSDCEPDLTRIKPVLLAHARYVLVKLSPMLDISLALKFLPETVEVHVVTVDGECKELLFLLKADPVGAEADSPCFEIQNLNGDSCKHQGTEANSPEPEIHCVHLRTGTPLQDFTFKKSEENQSECLFAEMPGLFLYEPNASLLKAGAFSILTQAFDLRKLHRNSHLYTSEDYIPEFPGRIFQVEKFFPYHSKDLKKQLGGISKANITVRNFPNSVAEIRKKTRLQEGGELYLFATTLLDEQKVLIRCKKP